jgi:hypothetical protein
MLSSATVEPLPAIIGHSLTIARKVVQLCALDLAPMRLLIQGQLGIDTVRQFDDNHLAFLNAS